MAQSVLGHCPVCQEELVATKLSCKHCGLELSNDFTLTPFAYLEPDDLYFVELFLQHSGNLKELQKLLKLSYPAVKKRLSKIQTLLQLKPESVVGEIEVVVSQLPIYQDESPTIKSIKNKLNQHNGLASIGLARGKAFQIYYEEFGNGIYATNLPQNRILTWKAFDCAVQLLKESDGRALKGQAMKGRLGDPSLGLDTIEGYVAHYAYGVQMGQSSLRMISALSSILEWANICENGYGYLQLKDASLKS